MRRRVGRPFGLICSLAKRRMLLWRTCRPLCEFLALTFSQTWSIFYFK
jgi:hypothetical protein